MNLWADTTVDPSSRKRLGRNTVLALIGALTFGLGMAAHAEIIERPGEMPAVKTMADAPNRGMTQSEVEARFGQPGEKRAAVGDPPISRWDYPRFNVYFEGPHVLHTVVTSK